MKKIAAFLPVVCLALLSVGAKADSLTLNSVPSGTTIGPYNLTLTTGSSSQSLSLFCLNDDREITEGETWTVTSYSGSAIVNGLDGYNLTQFQENAYIFSQLGNPTYTNQDIQEALWDIFTPNSESDLTTNAQALLTAAAADYSGVVLSKFTFYIADTNNAQDFIGVNLTSTTPVPEPSTLILLGSGLVGLAGVARRKLARA